METMIKWLCIGLTAVIISTSIAVVSEMILPEAQADTEPRYYQMMERQTRALEDIARTLGRIKDCGCRP